MKHLLGLVSACIALVCLAGVAQAEPGNDKVETESVANVSAIQPGKPFWVGFKYTITPDWHIYWKNPGDSGLATEVKLKLPEGFKAGELKFPVPERLKLPGDIINYAYEKQVMLMVEITPPKELSVGQTVKLGAKTFFLVCKEECVPGSADVSLELPVAAAASPANEELFKTWQDKLPVKTDPTDVAATANSMAVSNGGGTGNIKISWKTVPSDIQYIPSVLKTARCRT